MVRDVVVVLLQTPVVPGSTDPVGSDVPQKPLAVRKPAACLAGDFHVEVDCLELATARAAIAVLGKLESPVKIRLYFSQSDIPLPIKAYGRRVEDLLAEFRQAGRGKVTVEKFDPQPDSDAEDSATLEGVVSVHDDSVN